MPDPAPDAAYRATDYRVEHAPHGPFVIRVGEMSPDLEELLFDEVAFDWAYLTACNPGSVPLSDEENDRRTIELRDLLVAAGWKTYSGVSVGRDGTWREPSFLIIDMPESDVIAMARRFGQNAVVVGRTGKPARLVWVSG